VKWKFPKKPTESFNGQIKIIFSDLSQIKIKNLMEINRIVDKYKGQLIKLKKEIENARIGKRMFDWSSSIEVAYLLAIDDDDFRSVAKISDEEKKILKHYKK
jgi:hypothetical protein